MEHGQMSEKRGTGSRGTRGSRVSRVSFTRALVLGLVFGLAASACAGGQERASAADAKALAEYDLARDAFEAGRLREALGHVQSSLRIDEGNPDVHYLGAVILLAFCAADETSSDCRFEEAERHVRAALDAAPEMRDAKNVLGVILVHQKKYDEAVAVLKPLAEDILYGSPEKAWGNLGWAYLSRGSVDEAIDALRRSLAAQPMFCVGNYRLGLAYEKKGELSLAQEAFTKALETDRPECQKLQDGFAARARVADKLGQRDRAREDLERCRDLAPTTLVGKRCAAEVGAMQ
jgi:type IV pilus assembly protein PilF